MYRIMQENMLQSLIIVCLLSFIPAPGNAQIPDEFTNLQVLPKDISKAELIGNMKSFAGGLGVRCQFCHVGEEGQPLSEFDFVSDEKETKKKARVMIQLREAINKQFLTQLGNETEHTIQVNCVTCHRKQSKPRMLGDVLSEEISQQGIEAGITKYRELRQQYYGGFSFDFSERTLNKLADRLVEQEKKPDEVIAVLKLNLEFYPDSWMTYYGLGEIHAMKEDKEKAIENYEKAYELQPNPRIKQKIEQLSQK